MTEPDPLSGWTPDTSVAGAGWQEATNEERAAALAWSVAVLWSLSGRRFELHPHRVAPFIPVRRPSAYDVRQRFMGLGVNSAAGLGVNYRGGYASGGLACSSNVVRFPWPVHAVTLVQVDGLDLPAESWTLDPDGALVRTDGAGWPIAQNVYAPVPRWLVDLVIGILPDDAANAAAGRYAGELLRASKGQPCALPARARSITRPGLTIELPDPATLTENGRTGNGQVDAWLAAVNPAGLAAAPGVYSPDVAAHRFLS